LKKTLTALGVLTIGGFIIVIFGRMFIIFLLSLWSVFTPGKGTLERDLQKNEEAILLVKDYLVEADYSIMRIYKFDEPGMILEYSGFTRVPIDNAEVVEAMNELFKYGFEVISKSGNHILLQRWSRFSGTAGGIMYSTDGSVPEKNMFPYVTRLVSMSKEGWYYYEEVFDD
jgi:hypothetical protein